ncbi:MAG: hypothetical protein RL648_542 [Verrucomicrobiota bacterium]|jgi:hypothetical protein
MNSETFVHGLFFVGFRLSGALLVLAASLSLVFQVGETWYRFDPSYLAAFSFSLLFRPIILILAGIALYLVSPRLAHLAARPFRGSGQ